MNATQIAHWPGKDTAACDDHAAKLRSLARFMGFPLSCTPVVADTECDNCKNEAAVRGEGEPHGDS